MDESLKAYLDDMKRESREGLDDMKRELREHTETRLDDMKRELREHTETVETRLLREFWKWARTADARYRQNQGVVNGLELRVGIVEDRVADLERGKDVA